MRSFFVVGSLPNDAEELKRMIHHARPTHELRDQMKKGGGLSLREEGVLLALDGKTSLEEVLRVTQNDDEDPSKMVAATPVPPQTPTPGYSNKEAA